MQTKTTTLECRACGNLITVIPSRVSRTRYCSKACHNAAQTIPFTTLFEKYTDKTSSPHGCWLWIGHKTIHGYGVVGNSQRKQGAMSAHRLSYTIHIGPIPDGMWVLHNCPGGDNKACVNPEHLWIGTAFDNTHDMMAKGRAKHSYDFPKGHIPPFKIHPEMAPRGEANPSAKMTEDGVRMMREQHAGGTSFRALARQWNIDRSTVASIVKREYWKHVL